EMPPEHQRRLDIVSGMELTRDTGERVHTDLDRPQTVAAFSARAVVLVEGVSDQRALEALAVRRGRDLAAEGVSVVPMGGSKNIGTFLGVFGPRGLDVLVAGLCDAAEEVDFR